MRRGRLPQKLVMSPQDTAKVLTRLASTDVPGSQELYARIMGSWGNRPDRAYITFRPTPSERLVLRRIPLPARMVQSRPRYMAVYRCDKKPDVEVILRTQDIPPRKRKLRVAGGVRKFTLIKLYQTKESITMAKTKAAKGTKGKTKAADPVDELEAELEGLEEVDIEDEDEPEVEDTEEEDEDEEDDDESEDEDEDYSSQTNAQLKALCKSRGIKGIDKANKAKLIELLTADDAEDDEEDDEDEDDDGLDEMDRAALKARMVELDLGKAKKSQSDDDLRALIREAADDEEEEDDEEEDEEEEEEDEDDGYDETAPAKKGGTKSKGKGQPRQLVRELPKGKLGANDIAEMAGTKALNVRNFLRNNKTKFPKDEALGRYAFTAKQAQAIVTAMKKGGVQTTTKASGKKGGKKK